MDTHCELRKEAGIGNGKKVDTLIGRLLLLQVSLPALAPSGPLGLAGPAGSQNIAELTNSLKHNVVGQIRSSA